VRERTNVAPVLPPSTSRFRFREMIDADLSDIATLDISTARGPEGWIEWNRRNYAEHGFGLWVIETHAAVADEHVDGRGRLARTRPRASSGVRR
jgi:hypothetical protein